MSNSRYISSSLKLQVWKNYYGDTLRSKCKACDIREINCFECHYDHIQPISKGGTTTLDNLQPLCETCNTEKGMEMYRIYVFQDKHRKDMKKYVDDNIRLEKKNKELSSSNIKLLKENKKLKELISHYKKIIGDYRYNEGNYIYLMRKKEKKYLKNYGENRKLLCELDNLKKMIINVNPSDISSKYVNAISDKFPHLSNSECAELFNKCISNGGKIPIHSGEFKEIEVHSYNTNYIRGGIGVKQIPIKYYIWSCCPSIHIRIESKLIDSYQQHYELAVSFLIKSTYLANTNDCYGFTVKGLVRYSASSGRNIYKFSDISENPPYNGTKYIDYNKIIDKLKTYDVSIEEEFSGIQGQGCMYRKLYPHELLSKSYKNDNNITDKEFNEYIHNYGSRDPSSVCLNSEILDMSTLVEDTDNENQFLKSVIKSKKDVESLSHQLDIFAKENIKLMKHNTSLLGKSKELDIIKEKVNQLL